MTGSRIKVLKVRYFQNDFWMSSFEPKNKRKYFCISALYSWIQQKKSRFPGHADGVDGSLSAVRQQKRFHLLNFGHNRPVNQQGQIHK